jgi:hypothetical protein
MWEGAAGEAEKWLYDGIRSGTDIPGHKCVAA